jgi:hypothetical protein
MALGKKTGGRKRGVPNKLTTGAKEVIAQVAENVGGVARMTKWVLESKENERVFWSSIYIKLLPLQVAEDNPIHQVHKIEHVIVDPKKRDDDVANPNSPSPSIREGRHTAADRQRCAEISARCP